MCAQRYNNDSLIDPITNAIVHCVKKYNKNCEKEAIDGHTELYRDTECFIPNNGIKFYCFMFTKSERSTIMYFFTNTLSSSFFIETGLDNRKHGHVLLEGYMYGEYKRDYLVSDILYYGGDCVLKTYPKRHALLCSVIEPVLPMLLELNDTVSFYIHMYYTLDNRHLVEVYKARDFTHLEHVNGFFGKYNEERSSLSVNEQVFKIIEKGNYSDVYNVYNDTTLDYEGILYVKTLKEALGLYETFKSEKSSVRVKCSFNVKFSKFQITC